MKAKEWVRLLNDHPEVHWLGSNEIVMRYWAYDVERVRAARAQVHMNRIRDAIMRPIVRVIDGLSGHYERKRRETE